jgi:hypothetical protein
MTHKYRIHQQVRLRRPGFFDDRTPDGGAFEIIRLVRVDQTGEPGYRIRSGSVDRAVRETEIAPA